jgi:alpha-tubulin suppressor-like RCC1 family protein
VTGLTNGNTYTAQVAAINSYGPSAYSASSGSFIPVNPLNLFSWGQNNSGQLGQNDRVARSSPVQVGALTDWSLVAAGSSFSSAIKTNGTLWSWGNNGYGRLGLDDTTYRSSPVQVGSLTNWSKVSGGNFFCAAIKTDGTLWSWGVNNQGQLGQNIATAIFRSSPVQVGALTDWAQVSAGSSLCAAIKTNGTLWSWGINESGGLGQNISYNINRSSPVQIGALTDWSQVSTGSYFCAAIKTNGTLWSWGRNNSGRLGINDVYNRSSPVQVGALTNWAQVSAGQNFCVAVKTNGTLWSWGSGANGQLGQNSLTDFLSPVQVGALTDWSQVSSGFQFCAAIKTTGSIWSWGRNYRGQLGQNTPYSVNVSSPVQIGSLSTWLRLSQGSLTYHVLAIRN